MSADREDEMDVRRVLLLGLAGCGLLAGCSGSGGTSGASSSPDLTMHPIATCPASVDVPPDASPVVPDAAKPPTAVVKIGTAVAFTAPRGSKVTAVGKTDRSSKVCQSASGAGAQRRAVVVGIAPGFVQVALVVPGSPAVRRTLVTVTN